MHQTVEDRIAQGWIADQRMPFDHVARDRTRLDTTPGNAFTALSMGEPIMPDSLAVKEGDSSKPTARFRSW
ncbi:hypothetical protein [Pseudomonas fluorescens]|uniref:hypothetical protein n=1 Tax=Pseudomonas fluorescens TaxID=294 RepID=UPI0017850D93|nr:hypothetical protein [Pseudomonas fluorescens]